MAHAPGAAERLRELIYVFLKLGAVSYGGLAIMGIMHAEFQEKRRWLSKEEFLEGLALANMLPGPAATQLGIYIGHHRAGVYGGVSQVFVSWCPLSFSLMALTAAYSASGSVEVARHSSYGIGPVVLGTFIAAVWRSMMKPDRSEPILLHPKALAPTIDPTSMPVGLACHSPIRSSETESQNRTLRSCRSRQNVSR